jgi:hypothetical protein
MKVIMKIFIYYIKQKIDNHTYSLRMVSEVFSEKNINAPLRDFIDIGYMIGMLK